MYLFLCTKCLPPQINQLTIQDGAGANWARNNGTEVVFGDSADPFSATNQQCYGPAPITCFYYSRAPVGTGLAKGFGAGEKLIGVHEETDHASP